jgi:hypothetical protein
MTKVNYFYFLGIVPLILLAIRFHRGGWRDVLIASSSLMVCSIPVMFYWSRYGLLAFRNAWAASFGHDAPFYNVGLFRFAGRTLQESPGMLLPIVAVIVAIGYLTLRRRDLLWSPNVVALLVVLGYGAIALASSNREIRFVFPAIISAPFLLGLIISSDRNAYSRNVAAAAASFVFACLIVASLPMLHRPDRQSISKSETVLGLAMDLNAKDVLLGTDSATLNGNLMQVAIAVSPRPQFKADTLAWQAAAGVSLEQDLSTICRYDLVAFEEKDSLVHDPITNQRAPQYEIFTQAHSGGAPIKTVDGVRLYKLSHSCS